MRKISLAASAFALMAGGWTLLWLAAAHEMTRQIDAALAQEHQRGRTWACSNRTLSGFPFAIAVSCDHLAVVGLVLADATTGTLGPLTLRVGLPDPRRAHVTLTSPLQYGTADGQTDLSLVWTRMTIDLDNLLSPAITVAATGLNLAAQGRFDAVDVRSEIAASAALRVSPVTNATSPTADFAIAIRGVDVVALDQLVGDKKPADLTMIGRVDHAVFQDSKSMNDLIERWRLSGGVMDLSMVQITRDTSSVEAKGPLRLDEQHRIDGDFDATFIGADPILRRYGINPNVAAAGSLLNTLFGRHRETDKPRAFDTNRLTFPIRLREGRVALGPIQLPITLPPLY